ncbi:MAG: hypothetical protein PHQ96_03935 [Candidatus Omnitrophica bacterium]|nr:hypothetical protein [Candidatus Omnitrophota bacterium]
MSKRYMCPVCGFTGLQELPYNQENLPSYEICPCCGFEFGFDGDNNQDTFATFRKLWIDRGAQWFKPDLKPKYWDRKEQLNNLNKNNFETD